MSCIQSKRIISGRPRRLGRRGPNGRQVAQGGRGNRDPLAKQAPGLNTCIDETIDGRHGHVRVNVPVVHPLDEVDAPL